MKTLKAVVVFALALAVGWAAGPASASAFVRRYHASECHPTNNGTATYYVENNGLLNSSGYASAYICPFISDDNQPHTNVWALYVHGQKTQAGGSDAVTTCVKYWAANGFNCSFDTSTSAVGVWGIPSLLTAWNTDNGQNFPYIKLTLQPNSGFFGSFVVN